MFSKQSTLITLTLATAVVAAPLPVERALVPDLPTQLDLAAAALEMSTLLDTYSGRSHTTNIYGELLNSYVPIADDLAATVGENNVIALDVLADRLCIAGGDQGSICNELLSYAYAWYAAQQQSNTYQQFAAVLGPNNMKILSDDLRVLCLGPDSDGLNSTPGELCQRVAEDIDVLANSLIGQTALGEDDTNSNTFETYGISKLLPAPSNILP